MIYKRTIKNQFYVLQGVILYMIVLIAAAVFSYIYFGYADLNTLLILVLIMLPIFLIVLFLHLDYLFKAKTVEIDNTLRHVIFDDQEPIPFNEIDKIIIYTTPELVKSSVRSTPFGGYHYAKFVTKNGKRYFFTSLLCNKIQKELGYISVLKELKIRFIASTFFG